MGNAKTLARRLLKQNRGTASISPRPWRKIALEDYNGQINHATLCRFAMNDGQWLPKNKQLLIVLGVKRERKAKDAQPVELNEPRIITTFRRLGYLRKDWDQTAGAQ